MTQQAPLIKASIEAADLGYLADQIQRLESAGVDGLHFDVKDGRFIPEIAMGAMFVRGLRKYTKVPFDVHLWVAEPDQWLDTYIDAGADCLVVHVEACVNAVSTLEHIRARGCKAGVAINPETSAAAIEPIIALCDEVNVMTITPGVRGQLNPRGVENLSCVAKLAACQPQKPVVQADGAVSLKTRDLYLQAGATCLVAGYPIFSRSNFKASISELRTGRTQPETL